jgi:hypothetical protein
MPVRPVLFRFDVEGLPHLIATLGPGDHTVTLRNGGTVRGRVVDAAGNGMPEVWVSFYLAELLGRDPIQDIVGSHAKTGADGRFALRLQPRGYRVQTRAGEASAEASCTVRDGETTDLDLTVR